MLLLPLVYPPFFDFCLHLMLCEGLKNEITQTNEYDADLDEQEVTWQVFKLEDSNKKNAATCSCS